MWSRLQRRLPLPPDAAVELLVTVKQAASRNVLRCGFHHDGGVGSLWVLVDFPSVLGVYD